MCPLCDSEKWYFWEDVECKQWLYICSSIKGFKEAHELLTDFSPTLRNLTKKHTIPHCMDTHFCTHSFVLQTESNQRWNYQVFCEAVVFQLCKQYQCRWACGWMRVFMYVIRSRWNNARAWTQVKARGIVSKLWTADHVLTLCAADITNKHQGTQRFGSILSWNSSQQIPMLSVSSFTYKNHPAWISCFPPVRMWSVLTPSLCLDTCQA